MTAGFFQSKPRPAIFKLPEDTSKIFKHHGENQQDFDTVVKFINYFQEMFKFFPEWKQKGFWSGDEGDLTKNSPGFGQYSDPKQKRLENSGKLGSGYQERYGDWHDISLGEKALFDGIKVDLGGKPWGYGESEAGGNINWDASAYEYDFFTDLTVKNSENPIDASDYANYIAVKDSDKGKFQKIGASELKSARSFMAQFGKVNYYDFMVKGIDKLKFTDKNNNGTFELGTDVYDASACNFMWNSKQDVDNVPGKGAFLIMLNLLESRRRIYYAASNVFGKNKNIAESKSGEMIKEIDNFFDSKVGNADPHNFRMFGIYFKMMHSFRSAIQATAGEYPYIGGDQQGPGYVYSARDRAGFDAFTKWLDTNVKRYVAHLKTTGSADAGRVDTLLAEYRLRNKAYDDNDQYVKDNGTIGAGAYDIPQPFGMNRSDYWWKYSKEDHKKYVGWDSFSPEFDYKDPSKAPGSINPLWQKIGGAHPNYAIGQILGLGDQHIKGHDLYNNQDLNGTNWVVHLVGRFMKFKDHDTQQGVNCLSINALDSARFQSESAQYSRKKEKYEDDKIEEKSDEAAEDARILGNQRADAQKSQQKAQQQRQQIASDAEKAAAKRKLMMQLFSQMFENSNKNKK
ncbi:MAG: hypothetical protein HQ564_06710 [Candidatus Saganbacteria bacterium]|nr:hypothetical protein [Candidatus Saganbacteria bacterium]